MSHVNVSGTWKNLVNGTAVNVGGTWKTVSRIFVNVSGTWKEAWASWVLAFSGTTTNTAAAVGSNATAEVVFRTDGTVDMRDNLSGGYTEVGAWISDTTEAATSGAEIRWTNAVGDTMTLSTTAEDTWHDITASDLQLYITDTDGSAINQESVTFDMQVRDAGDVTQDTQSYTLTANRTDL